MKGENKSREYGRKMPSWLKALIFALLCTILVIGLKKCVTGKSGEVRASASRVSIDKDEWNNRIIDSCIELLKDGDLVVRTGKDITSQMFRKFNQKDQTYSHAGFVIIENGYPYIYHSIGGEDNPDAQLRRDSASFWFSPLNNLGLGVCRLDLNAEQFTQLQQTVKQYYKERKMFDMGFDLQSDDRMYCAEFVYKTLNKVVGLDKYV